MKDRPMIFVHGWKGFANDKIFKMLEGDSNDPRYIALMEAMTFQRTKWETQKHLDYSLEWYVCSKGDPNHKVPEGIDKDANIAVLTYACMQEGAELKNQVLEELKNTKSEIVLSAMRDWEDKMNFAVSMDICSLPILTPPKQSDPLVEHAAIHLCALENMQDLRLKMADHFKDRCFMPAYVNN